MNEVVFEQRFAGLLGVPSDGLIDGLLAGVPPRCVRWSKLSEPATTQAFAGARLRLVACTAVHTTC